MAIKKMTGASSSARKKPTTAKMIGRKVVPAKPKMKSTKNAKDKSMNKVENKRAAQGKMQSTGRAKTTTTMRGARTAEQVGNDNVREGYNKFRGSAQQKKYGDYYDNTMSSAEAKAFFKYYTKKNGTLGDGVKVSKSEAASWSDFARIQKQQRAGGGQNLSQAEKDAKSAKRYQKLNPGKVKRS